MEHFTLRIYFLILLNMKALIVKSKNPTEMKFLSDLLKKLGMSARVVDIEEVEDLGMSILMKEADRTKKVSRATIMKKLRS